MSFAGAALPIAAGALVLRRSWIVVVMAILVLAGLGAALGCTVAGRPVRWAVTMGTGGVV
ncbi:hypothetical protein AB0K74_06865 [Streptomyces sp. NPDC056159]|uniref:hypothetical protein n=1 Tax=Streptomyces sp. NPDC056159 TaxID=3155537 RepID=UPI003416822D